jgi:hypothetical protein
MVEDLTGGGVDHQIGGALGADDTKAPGVGHLSILPRRPPGVVIYHTLGRRTIGAADGAGLVLTIPSAGSFLAPRTARLTVETGLPVHFAR